LEKYQESFGGSFSVFTTPEWLNFLKNDKKGIPIIFQIEDGKLESYFVGLIFRKFGIKMFASPFEQWGTCDMGFCATDGSPRISYLSGIVAFIKKKYHCHYFEMIDSKIGFDDLQSIKCHVITQKTYMLRINRTDEELFKCFKTDCRNFIRQFEKRGARIEQVSPSDTFADEYYNQLIDVFTKQNLKPHNSRSQIHILMNAFASNHKHILCLKVTDPNGICIATSIFLGCGDTAYFWGAASYREYQNYRPNEYMIWTAIKYWREYGCLKFDMVGLRDYKKKFGPDYYEYPRIVITDNRLLILGRQFARKAITFLRKIRGKL